MVQRGWAIECRINAEDPSNNFQPSAGTITRWQAPGGPGVRLDTHAVAGYRVPPNYDSLVAKLLSHQPTRAEAIAVMRRALGEFIVEGIRRRFRSTRRFSARPRSSTDRWTRPSSSGCFSARERPNRGSDQARRRIAVTRKNIATTVNVTSDTHLPL